MPQPYATFRATLHGLEVCEARRRPEVQSHGGVGALARVRVGADRAALPTFLGLAPGLAPASDWTATRVLARTPSPMATLASALTPLPPPTPPRAVALPAPPPDVPLPRGRARARGGGAAPPHPRSSALLLSTRDVAGARSQRPVGCVFSRKVLGRGVTASRHAPEIGARGAMATLDAALEARLLNDLRYQNSHGDARFVEVFAEYADLLGRSQVMEVRASDTKREDERDGEWAESRGKEEGARW